QVRTSIQADTDHRAPAHTDGPQVPGEPVGLCKILSRMAQYSAQLDGVFVALADPTRRWVIRRLGHGPTSVGDLARELPMTLPSFMKHVRTLESNGLIHTTKSGRVRTCVLNRERLAVVDDWLAEQRRVWEERTDRLERLVTDQQENQQ
ncbi:helix-turn-helix transcriptional regulator, partial [Micromonospora sp. NPDC049089]|uniref:ArsR/SmtB family transcription factor n=2 Tax=Micromonospora TaxID=1873 RepID=UPI0033F81C32